MTGTVTSGAFADLKESENEQQQSRNGGDERQPVSVGRTAAERLYEVGQDLDELQYGFNDLGHAGVYASGAHVYRPKCMETGGQSSDRHETWAWNSSQLIPVPYLGAPVPAPVSSSTGDGLAGLQCPALINEPGAGFPLFM